MPGVKGKSGGRRNEAAARAGRAIGPKPRGVRAEIGPEHMQSLRALAAAEGRAPEELAARWLGERVVAEYARYERERGGGPEKLPPEWGGEVL
jgi:hypothetical protein